MKYHHCRTARFQCAAICTANPDCVAYYYKGSECHEANGIGVIGALPDSSTAMMVYIDSSLDPGKMALVKQIIIRLSLTLPNCTFLQLNKGWFWRSDSWVGLI